MSNFAMTHNIDAFIGAAAASDDVSLTAGGAGDNTEVNGLAIDRAALSYPLSASFIAHYKAVLGAGNTISLSAVVQTADDSGFTENVNTLATFAKAVVDTGAAGGSTQRGVVRFPVDFAGAQEFVRIQFTPDLSAANTDTADVSVVAVLGGQDYLPA
ncbi:MAG TPA: hypothetical protein VMD97_01980 [Candidatus Aquilonibacter sp.]|nr:hypothetical protein [Candidatus Aquilonibacter sp.]